VTKAAKVQKLGVNNDDYLDMNPPNQVNPNPSSNPQPCFLNVNPPNQFRKPYSQKPKPHTSNPNPLNPKP
jgi:hypothetical protein